VATGDTTDILCRLKAVLPLGWFPPPAAAGEPSTTPVLDGVLSGCAAAWAFCYSLLAYVRLQTRIATATDVWLDAIAVDYFGGALSRFPNETDAAFSPRIRANLLPIRATRAGVIDAVIGLLGVPPAVFEPADTGDTGAYGDGTRTWRGMAWNTAGGWGSMALPFQAFLTVTVPPAGGIAYADGWGGYSGGYGVGAIEWIGADMIVGQIPPAAIFQTIANAAPAGSIMWVRLGGWPPGEPFLTTEGGDFLTTEGGDFLTL
jgi:hypothetical protein